MASDNNEEDTPLHRAARFGIPQLAALYLSSGAAVNAVNSHKETPLLTAAFWAFDQKEQLYSEDHHLVCRILLDRNAGGPSNPCCSYLGSIIMQTRNQPGTGPVPGFSPV